MEQKLADLKEYRSHLHSQYVDRSIQWSLNELSEDHNSGTLVILVDGVDQAKFRLPRHPGLRAVSSLCLGFSQRVVVSLFHDPKKNIGNMMLNSNNRFYFQKN